MLFVYIVIVVLILASLLLRVRLAIVTVVFFFISSFLSLRSLSTVSHSYLSLLFSILLLLFLDLC